MEYTEENMHMILDTLGRKGYKELLVIDEGMFYSMEKKKHFPLQSAREVLRINFSAGEEGPSWSLHALHFSSGNHKGIVLWGAGFYPEQHITAVIEQQWCLLTSAT
jgi:hypothetical protein